MARKRFESYDKEFQLLTDTSPMLVSVIKNSDDETDEQFIATHDRFITLNDITKDKLADPKTAAAVQNVGKTCNLSLVQMSDIARAIRSYYFGELKLEDFSFVLAKEMNIDLTKAQQIFQIIKERIIDDQSYERALQASLISLPLSEALRIHPEVGEQLITSSKISLRNFPYPVRPSIKNWLADYTFQLGYEKHESMARSQYLFQGANTKNLPDSEKQKLAYLLKSFDENSPITVNKNTKQIVFPAITPASRPANETSPSKTSPTQARPVAPLPSEQKNINSMQFSYRQTLPYEKTIAPPVPTKTLPQNFPTSSNEMPASSRSMEHISKGEPSSPPNLPKNVVDLKNINQL
jgi:hypothetical protein